MSNQSRVLPNQNSQIYWPWIAYQLGFWRSFFLFVLTEVLLLLWIRDSLILNVLMLLYPIEAIQEWQVGR